MPNDTNRPGSSVGHLQPWIAVAARLGYAAKGVLYACVGALSLQAALMARSTPDGTRGALAEIAQKPFGRIMLGVVVLGLLLYCCWRYLQAWLDIEEAGTSVGGLVRRIGFVVSGTSYLVLCLWSGETLFGFGATRDGAPFRLRDWSSELMTWPFGRLILAGIGLIVVGTGLYQARRSYKLSFLASLDYEKMSMLAQHAIRVLGRIGIGARALIFLTLGSLIVSAAYRFDASRAKSTGDILSMLAQQPLGTCLLGAISLALLAYGSYCLLRARYRVIHVPPSNRQQTTA